MNRVHVSLNVVVTGLHTYNVINNLLHLQKKKKLEQMSFQDNSEDQWIQFQYRNKLPSPSL